MKHIKLFEAEIKRTFSEWLGNPSAPKRDNNYTFIFPVRKDWKFIDEGEFTLSDIDEFTKTESGMSLIDRIGRDMDLQHDEVLANEDEIYQAWLEQEMEGLGKYDRFLNTFGLNFKESIITHQNFIHLKRSFNGSHIARQFDARSFGGTFNVLDIKMKSLSESGDEITLVVQVDRNLNEDQKETIKDFLTGQLADEWGRGISNQVNREKRGNLEFDTTIEVWWNSGYPAWGIEIEESISESVDLSKTSIKKNSEMIEVVDEIIHLLTEVGEGKPEIHQVTEDWGGIRLYDSPIVQSGYLNIRDFYLVIYVDYTPKSVDEDYVLSAADRLEDIGVKMICHDISGIGLSFLLTGLENYNNLKSLGFKFFDDFDWNSKQQYGTAIGKYDNSAPPLQSTIEKSVAYNAGDKVRVDIKYNTNQHRWGFTVTPFGPNKPILSIPSPYSSPDRGMAEVYNIDLQSKWGRYSELKSWKGKTL